MPNFRERARDVSAGLRWEINGVVAACGGVTQLPYSPTLCRGFWQRILVFKPSTPSVRYKTERPTACKPTEQHKEGPVAT